MKLAAIYNVWDGVELLGGSINCVKDCVDEIIIVYQVVSNYGEVYDPWEEVDPYSIPKRTMFLYVPDLQLSGAKNEIEKRKIGLTIAREKGCTHFLHLDCDEYYQDFGVAKEFYINSSHQGSVCSLYTFFKDPTLRFQELDNYYVPFIHALKPWTTVGVKIYPFYVDPTRRINESDVIHLPVVMYHYSWVRKNIERKVRNSSALVNIRKGTWEKDWDKASEGQYIKDFNQSLTTVKNIFDINLGN